MQSAVRAVTRCEAAQRAPIAFDDFLQAKTPEVASLYRVALHPSPRRTAASIHLFGGRSGQLFRSLANNSHLKVQACTTQPAHHSGCAGFQNQRCAQPLLRFRVSPHVDLFSQTDRFTHKQLSLEPCSASPHDHAQVSLCTAAKWPSTLYLHQSGRGPQAAPQALHHYRKTDKLSTAKQYTAKAATLLSKPVHC